MITTKSIVTDDYKPPKTICGICGQPYPEDINAIHICEGFQGVSKITAKSTEEDESLILLRSINRWLERIHTLLTEIEYSVR